MVLYNFKFFNRIYYFHRNLQYCNYWINQVGIAWLNSWPPNVLKVSHFTSSFEEIYILLYIYIYIYSQLYCLTTIISHDLSLAYITISHHFGHRIFLPSKVRFVYPKNSRCSSFDFSLLQLSPFASQVLLLEPLYW